MNKNISFLITSFAFSSLKKRDTVAKRTPAEALDDSEKPEKSKTEEIDTKSDDDKETEKKKSSKKSATTENSIEGEDTKEIDATDEKTDATAEGDELQENKSSDAEDDDKKGDDKEKRKKFVRLWCVHCRIESATFKVDIHFIRFSIIPMYFQCIFLLNSSNRTITITFTAVAINWCSGAMD